MSKEGVSNLIGRRELVSAGRCFLRILEEEDASQEYCRWLNDPIVNRYLETHQASVAGLKAYIAGKLQADNCLFFGIFWKENGKHIGNIKLEPVDLEKKAATLGVIIGDKDYWNRGIATEVTSALVDWGFKELGLKEIKLGVISRNRPAIKVYEKCGFETFKIDKQAIDHGGKLYDQIWMHKINI